MKITYQGWSRDHGPNTLLDRKITNESIRGASGKSHYFKGTFRVDKMDILDRHTKLLEKGIRISFDADITANGSYLVHVGLSIPELLLLMPDTIGDLTLREISQYLIERDVTDPAT